MFRNRILKPSLGQPCDEAKVQAALEKLPGHFDYLEGVLGNAEYLVGGRLTMADLALACQLINMQHGSETLEAARWPRLAGHFARIKARASVQRLLPRELRTLEKIGAR